MPSRWEIPLPGADPEAVRAEHLHAAISNWFDDDEEQHHRPVKPYSVSPPREGPNGVVIEIGLLDDALVPRLLSRAGPGSRLRLGRQIITATKGAQQSAVASWADLGRGRPVSAWGLRFVTPLTFRRGNRFTPLPAPSPILGGLRRSWNAFAPPELAVTLDLSGDPAWVTDIDGHNEVMSVNGRTVSGFLGRLRIECEAGSDAAGAVSRIVALAPFSGIGAYTTRCFGVTRLDPTWQPGR